MVFKHGGDWVLYGIFEDLEIEILFIQVLDNSLKIPTFIKFCL
jgi:hypothetical protein